MTQPTEPKRRGRPTLPPELRRVDVALRLPGWLAAWLQEQPQPTPELIEAALVRQHRLKPPK